MINDQLRPEDDEIFIEQILALCASQEHAEAEQKLKIFLSNKPEHARGLGIMGGVQVILGNLEEAERCLQKSLELNASIPQTHYSYATYYKCKQQDGEARFHLDRALQLDPKFERALQFRGQLAMDAQEYDSAIADFSQLIESSPHTIAGWHLRCFARLQNGNFELALQDIDQVETLAGRASWIEDTRGCILLRMDKAQEAIESFRHAVDLASQESPSKQCAYQIHLANALVETSQLQEAMDVLDKACELDPTSAEAFYCRGDALERQGRTFEAIQDFGQAAELGGGFRDAKWRRTRLSHGLTKSATTPSITSILQDWMRLGGHLPQLINAHNPAYLKTESEILLLADAIRALVSQGPKGKLDVQGLSELVGIAQMIPDSATATLCREHCLPIFQQIVEQRFAGVEWPDDGVMEVLRLLAFRGQAADHLDLIIQAVHTGFHADSVSWVSIITGIMQDQKKVENLVSKLTVAPQGKIAAMLVDPCNRRCADNSGAKHLFDSDQGIETLKSLLSDAEEGDFWLTGVVAALAFLSPERAEQLAAHAVQSPDLILQVVAAWALAKRGDASQIAKLRDFSRDFRCADQALGCLEELGKSAEIPPEALSDEARAKAAFAQWLQHPNELAEFPDEIETFDHRTLFWPPTNDRREVWLFRYKLEKAGETESGIGMVGSVTFVLFGQDFEGQSPADVYLKHCGWEMQQQGIRGNAVQLMKENNPDLFESQI